MNERIRELAEKAGYAPLKPRTFADDLNEIFLRKFAELLISECAPFVGDPNSEAVKKMMKHFGLEE